MENRLSYKQFQESLKETVSLELNKQGTYHCELTHTQKNNVVLSDQKAIGGILSKPGNP